MMKRFFSVILFVIMCIPLISQEVTVEAKIDSSNIFIGDHAVYSITVNQPPDIKLLMPDLKDSLCTDIEILSQSLTDTSLNDMGQMILKKDYIITSFDTGFYQIPPYYLEYNTGQGEKRYYSGYVSLKVNRVDITPPDSTDVIFDIAGPEHAGYSPGEILPWVLLVLLVGTGIWLLYRFLPGKKEKEVQEGPKIPDEPIHIITFRELDKLEKKKLWQEGKVKQYFSELTDILRYYIAIRFGINAMEMTSEEIIALMNKEKTGRDEQEILRRILQYADLSKFAKYIHDASINTSSLSDARKFVKNTYKYESDTVKEEDRQTEQEGKEVNDD